MNKTIIVYSNKTHDVWARDAYKWITENGYKEEDFEIISEVLFKWRHDNKTLDNRPVIFITSIITNH